MRVNIIVIIVILFLGATKKPSPQKLQTDEMKSVLLDNVQAIPASMSPVVVLYRMSTRSLDKLKEQNGVIRLTEFGDEAYDQTLVNEKIPDTESSVGSNRNPSKRNQPDKEIPVKRRRTDVFAEAPENQNKENPFESNSRICSIIPKSLMRNKFISSIKPSSKTAIARKQFLLEESITSVIRFIFDFSSSFYIYSYSVNRHQ